MTLKKIIQESVYALFSIYNLEDINIFMNIKCSTLYFLPQLDDIIS